MQLNLVCNATVMWDAGDQWWLMNDDIRRRVYSSEVLNSDAYMLFYVRATPRQHPPVVPPSHVTPPSTKKRCATLSPLEEEEVENGEIADNMDLVPLCKRAKCQQQLQQQQQHQQLTAPANVTLDPAFADAQSGYNHRADSTVHSRASDAVGSSHTRTELLTQHNNLHGNANGNSSAGVPNGHLVNRQSKQQDEEEGMANGGGRVSIEASGQCFLGPLANPLPDANKALEASADGDLLTYQSRRSKGQLPPPANGAAWNATGAKPGPAAAESPTMTYASSSSPAGDSPRTAASGSPKRFGFMGFSIANPLKGRSAAKLSSAAASGSPPECMTPPSQRLTSAQSGLGLQPPLVAQRKQLLSTPMKPLLFDEQSDTRSGQKRSRAESFAETEDLKPELNLDDEAPVAQASRKPLPRSHNPAAPHAASTQFILNASGTLPARPCTHSQTESKSSTHLLPVSIQDAMLPTLCVLFSPLKSVPSLQLPALL